MLMLYTYRLTIFDKELQENYTCDHTIIADTTDDRTVLLRKSLFDPHECSVTRHILVCARALSLSEIAILDRRMSLIFSVHPIYLTFHRHGESRGTWQVAPPRIRTNVEVDFGNLAWPTSAVCFGPPSGTLMLWVFGSAGA